MQNKKKIIAIVLVFAMIIGFIPITPKTEVKANTMTVLTLQNSDIGAWDFSNLDKDTGTVIERIPKATSDCALSYFPVNGEDIENMNEVQLAEVRESGSFGNSFSVLGYDLSTKNIVTTKKADIAGNAFFSIAYQNISDNHTRGMNLALFVYDAANNLKYFYPNLADSSVETPNGNEVVYIFTPEFVDDGYSFVFRALKYGNYDENVTASKPLILKVEKKGVIISFDGNGGDVPDTWGMSSVWATDDAEELPVNQFVKEGYTFAGWKDGNNIYVDGAIIDLSVETRDYIELTAQWEKRIEGSALNKLAIHFYDDSIVYDSVAKTPEIWVTYDDDEIDPKYYDVEYTNNIEPSDAAQITITGKRGYVFTKTQAFSIDRCPIDTLDIAINGATMYNGYYTFASELAAQDADITITQRYYDQTDEQMKEKVLIKDTDYTSERTFINDANSPYNGKFDITGINNYTGTTTVYWKFIPNLIDFYYEDINKVYDGEDLWIPHPQITDDLMIYYTDSYDEVLTTNNTERPVVKDCGNYTFYYRVEKEGFESRINTVDINIYPQSITVSNVTGIDKEWDMTSDALLDTSNIDIQGLIGSDQVNVSAYGYFEDDEIGENKTVHIIYSIENDPLSEAAANYTIGEGSQETTTASINKRMLAEDMFTYTDTFYYNGTSQGPSFDASFDCNGIFRQLSEYQDYYVKAGEQSQTDVGDYSVTMAGLGNFTGEVVLPWSIVKKQVTPTENSLEVDYDGRYYSAYITGDIPEGSTVKYGTSLGTYNLDASPSYKDVGTYYIYAKLTHPEYEDWTGVLELKINPRTITVSGLKALDKTYDGNTGASIDKSNMVIENIVNGENIDVTATGTFENKYPGLGKEITVDIAINDPNYILSSSRTYLYANITNQKDIILIDPETYAIMGSMIVANGTTKAQLQAKLPSNVLVQVSDNTEAVYETVSVIWDIPDYDATIATEQTITVHGAITLNDGTDAVISRDVIISRIGTNINPSNPDNQDTGNQNTDNQDVNNHNTNNQDAGNNSQNPSDQEADSGENTDIIRLSYEMTVNNGTQINNLPLPETVTVKNETVSVNWNTLNLSYDPSSKSFQSFKVPGSASLSDKTVIMIDMTVNVKGDFSSYTATNTSKSLVKSNFELTVKNGTKAEDIGLPSFVMSRYRGNYNSCNIVWDTTDYDGNTVKEKTYVLYGTVTLPSGTTDVVKATVFVEPASVIIELDENQTETKTYNARVNNGEKNAGLPEYAIVNTVSSGEVITPIEWTIPGYIEGAPYAQSVTASGEVLLPNGNTAHVTVYSVIEQSYPYIVVNENNFSLINQNTYTIEVPNGTSVEDFGLPDYVIVTSADETENLAKVSWSSPQYDVTSKAYQSFTMTGTVSYRLMTTSINVKVIIDGEQMFKTSENVSNTQTSSLEIDVVNTDENLINILLTEQEKALINAGIPVSISFNFEKAKNEQILSGYTTGLAFDIEIYKQIGELARQQITQTVNGNLSMEFKMPSSLKSKTNKKLYRKHNDRQQEINMSVDQKTNVTTFSSNLFSVFSVIYPNQQQTKTNSSSSNNKTTTTSENDNSSSDKTKETTNITKQDTVTVETKPLYSDEQINDMLLPDIRAMIEKGYYGSRQIYQNGKGVTAKWTKGKLKLSWNKTIGAQYYNVYVGYKGKTIQKHTTNITDTSVLIDNINGEAINKNRYIKYYVEAYTVHNGEPVRLGRTRGYFIPGTKAGETYEKGIAVNSNMITVEQEGVYTLVSKYLRQDKTKSLAGCKSKIWPKFRYEIADENIATISPEGKIKGKNPGETYLYVYSRSGRQRRVKITVAPTSLIKTTVNLIYNSLF